MSVAQHVDAAVKDHAVTVFSKSWCPHCAQAKKLLKSLNLEDLLVVELDQAEDGDEQQDYLQKKTGQRTVPNIFIHQKHIGGNSDLQSLNSSGKLTKLIQA